MTRPCITHHDACPCREAAHAAQLAAADEAIDALLAEEAAHVAWEDAERDEDVEAAWLAYEPTVERRAAALSAYRAARGQR